MQTKKSSRKYTTVTIPRELANKLKPLKGYWGFGTVSQVVQWCIRSQIFQIERWLDEIEKNKEKSKYLKEILDADYDTTTA